jgi:hypothetical protein
MISSFPTVKRGGERASAGQTYWLNGRPADSDSISDQWSKVRNIAIFRKKFWNDLNQNIDQKADIWSKPSKDRKFFANSGYWGRRQVAKNGRIEVFRCLVEICPPLVQPLTLVQIQTIYLEKKIWYNKIPTSSTTSLILRRKENLLYKSLPNLEKRKTCRVLTSLYSLANLEKKKPGV